MWHFCQNLCCGIVLDFSQLFIFRCIYGSIEATDVSNSTMSNDVSGRPKWVFNPCPVSRARHQPLFFVCQMSSVFPCCITPPCLLSLSQTLQWSITSNTAICHECLMSHRDRKLFDHTIRHSIRNLVLDVVPVSGLNPSMFLRTFWLKQFALFYFLHTSKHFLALLSSAILSSSFFYPLFFLSWCPPVFTHCAVMGRKPDFPLLLKNRKLRQIVPYNVVIKAYVHVRPELDDRRTRGNCLPAYVQSKPNHTGTFKYGTLLFFFFILFFYSLRFSGDHLTYCAFRGEDPFF